MLKDEDVFIQISSDNEYEYLVADVFYKNQYMFMITTFDEANETISIVFSDPTKINDQFVGHLEIDDYSSIVKRATDKYRKMMFSR